MSCNYWTWILAFTSLFCSPVWGQQPQAASGTTRPLVELDSNALFYTLSLQPERAIPEADTLPDATFYRFDPTRREAIDWGNLGNIGSPARPLLFTPKARLGFQTGIDAFDLYKTKAENLHFHRHLKSFSDVFFSQGRNQEENLVRAKFSRSFEKGASFTLDYRTFTYLGQFIYQRVKHNALSVGLWVPWGKRYEGFLIYNNNYFRQQENGGIVTDTVFNDGQFAGPSAAPVWLPEKKAFTRHAHQHFQYLHYYRLAGAAGKRALRLGHQLDYKTEKYKFTDANPGKDTLFLGEFVTDQRGLRHYIQMSRIENHLFLSTFKSKIRGRPSDWLSLGIKHAFIRLEQEPLSRNKISNLFATGDIGLQFSDKLSFRGNAALGLPGNLGEYLLQGDLALNLGLVGQLRAGVLSQRYAPLLLQERLYVTAASVWDKNFSNPVENLFWGSYALPKLRFEATVRASVVNNYIYYDQSGKPAQLSDLPVLQFIIKEDFKLWKIHLDNTVALQQSNRLDDVLRLPEWFSKNSLYFSGRVFNKRMLLNTGVDFRINAQFRPDAWQPVSWQWHLQDTLTQKPYPQLDFFAAFKIQNFRFFLRYDNLNTLWDKGAVFYQTAWHPQQFGAMRIGIAWRFLDRNSGQDEASGGNAPPSGIGPSGRPAGRQ